MHGVLLCADCLVICFTHGIYATSRHLGLDFSSNGDGAVVMQSVSIIATARGIGTVSRLLTKSVYSQCSSSWFVCLRFARFYIC